MTKLKALAARVLKTARNPVLHPVEAWALRAIVAYAAVKLGLDASKL